MSPLRLLSKPLLATLATGAAAAATTASFFYVNPPKGQPRGGKGWLSVEGY